MTRSSVQSRSTAQSSSSPPTEWLGLTEKVLFRTVRLLYLLHGYGKDQGEHGETEMLRVLAYHALHEAEQEEGEGEAGALQVLQVLPQEYEAHGEQVVFDEKADELYYGIGYITDSSYEARAEKKKRGCCVRKGVP